MQTTDERYKIAAQEDRCAPRTKLTIPSTLRASGGRAFQSVVHDLSISGFSAASINRMHEGQVCWLTLPGLESLQAQVVWWDMPMVSGFWFRTRVVTTSFLPPNRCDRCCKVIAP